MNHDTFEKAGRSNRRVRLVGTAWILTGILALLLGGCVAPPLPAITPVATATVAPPPAELPAPGTVLPEAPTVSVAETPTSPAPAASATLATGEPSTTGQPNRIVIPKIGLDAPIVSVGWKVIDRGDRRFTEWETADAAAGRHINSAKPGEQGNVVLSGHHNTKGEVFRAISDGKLAIGDQIYLYDEQGKRWTYVTNEVTKPLLEVGATEQQRLENARYIQPTHDGRVTLVTCWPYYTNTHRVVVVATLAQ